MGGAIEYGFTIGWLDALGKQKKEKRMFDSCGYRDFAVVLLFFIFWHSEVSENTKTDPRIWLAPSSDEDN